MGERFGSVVLLHPSGKAGYWLTRCDCAKVTAKRPRNLRACGPLVTCGDGDRHPSKGRRKTEPGYVLTHERLARRKGRARAYPCSHCGRPAYSWAYSNAAPLEREHWGKSNLGYLCAYSDLGQQYRPLCASCHKHWDLATGRTQGKPLALAAVMLQVVLCDGEEFSLWKDKPRARRKPEAV